ncbi:MAG: PEP-CTERM sorting domain-containing protein [Pirellulales bacterium]|nr:PEP-CTERM sorting domain-containing protein [Pirellulales bacterium]
MIRCLTCLVVTLACCAVARAGTLSLQSVDLSPSATTGSIGVTLSGASGYNLETYSLVVNAESGLTLTDFVLTSPFDNVDTKIFDVDYAPEYSAMVFLSAPFPTLGTSNEIGRFLFELSDSSPGKTYSLTWDRDFSSAENSGGTPLVDAFVDGGVTISSIPEPSSLAILSTALVTIGVAVWRRRRPATAIPGIRGCS